MIGQDKQNSSNIGQRRPTCTVPGIVDMHVGDLDPFKRYPSPVSGPAYQKRQTSLSLLR